MLPLFTWLDFELIIGCNVKIFSVKQLPLEISLEVCLLTEDVPGRCDNPSIPSMQYNNNNETLEVCENICTMR